MIRATAIVPKKLINTRRLIDAVERGLDDTAREVQERLEATTRGWRHTVRFRITKPSSYTRIVATDNPVFIYQNDGTRPHRITARRRRFLRFEVHGRTVFARSVRHPGTKPRGLTKQVARGAAQQLARNIQRRIQDALRVS